MAAGIAIGLLAGAAHGQTPAPIRIGASLGLTGSYADLGQTLQRGYQLCVKQANEQGGLLKRRIELTVVDDKSETASAVAIYERLVAHDRIDLVFSPYSSPITDAVADVTEKYAKPMVAAGAATTSIFRKGRRFLFMLLSPGELYLEGVLDIAAKRGLKTIAIVHEDTLFPKFLAQSAADLAKKRGLHLRLFEGYPRGTKDFAPLLVKAKAANPDIVIAGTYVEDAIAIARQMKESDINPKMFSVTIGGDLPKFYETLGRSAEFIYGASQWEEDLVTLRAGGLIPIARQYPGAREFVEAYRKEFPGADLSYQTAQGYGGCQVLLEGVRRAGSLDPDRIREAILKFDSHTAFGAFKVDQDGFQVGHKMVVFQWQDGKKAIVWPEDLAPARPRFPTPPWSQR
jgi:branched-chain amino acid transport system substrate-binding protein